MIRFFDILLSSLGLLILSPVFLILAVWIKLDSNGSVFYKQERVGKLGIDFKLYKFRSMRVGSEKMGLLTVGETDARITRSGYFIRKYKFDEIPQLINVLKGEMSIVGPRPEVRKYVDLYDAQQLKVLSVKPGITDWASIQFSNENAILKGFDDPEKGYIDIILPEKIKMNMKFIQDISLKNYFTIIFVTIRKIIQKAN
jgi:lipopolysaccharide/colanic/teichoic acid biosynthesis glycosyltransferase